MKLETERLILRPVLIEDGAFIFELMNSQGWMQFIGDRNIKSISDAERYIAEKMLPQFQEKGFGNYVMEVKGTKEKLGTCGLYCRPGLQGVDIGFATLPQNFRRGYTFEASSRLLEYGRDELKLSPIQAITNKSNVASQKLIEKLGLQFVEIIDLESIPETQMLYRLPIDRVE